jgi:hypothetical protein
LKQFVRKLARGQLAPEKRFHGAVAHLVQPQQLPRLTQDQAEVLAIVISDGMATRRRIEEVRGAAQLSIGADGPISLPRDSSETLALLLSRGLLCADRDDHAMGRPLIYRPTPRLLQLLGAETLEEARGRRRGGGCKVVAAYSPQVSQPQRSTGLARWTRRPQDAGSAVRPPRLQLPQNSGDAFGPTVRCFRRPKRPNRRQWNRVIEPLMSHVRSRQPRPRSERGCSLPTC